MNQGTPAELAEDPDSLIGPYLKGTAMIHVRKINNQDPAKLIDFTVKDYYNLQNVRAEIPVNRLTTVTGFSGAGKTSLILDSLVPAITAQSQKRSLPKQVTQLKTPLKKVVSVNAEPIGKSVRSTVATYTNIMNNLRKLYASQPAAKKRKYTASYFSYNNKQGACPTCGGTGSITLDIQFFQTCNKSAQLVMENVTILKFSKLNGTICRLWTF